LSRSPQVTNVYDHLWSVREISRAAKLIPRAGRVRGEVEHKHVFIVTERIRHVPLVKNVLQLSD